MPLLNNQPFEPNLIPENLGPDDEVYYFSITNEIFTNHDDYFNRYLHVQSLVWTCSRTGKSGLTYEEALQSERRLEDPQQHVKKKRKRRKNDESAEQTDSETPKKTKTKKKAKTTTTSPENLDDTSALKTDEGNTTSVSVTEQTPRIGPDGQPMKKKKKKYPYDPKKYAMPVPDGFDPSLLTPTGKIDGRKLKSKKNQQLADELLAASGYVPKPPSATPGKRGKKPRSEDEKREDEARKKENEAKKKAQAQAELAKERELETKRKKEALALARQLEKQKKEQEKKKEANWLQNWEKRCEDLERDDLKKLPQPTPIDCEIPERLFGDSMFIMEAIYNFHDLYNLNTIYPEGMNFDTLEEILLDKHEDGALGTLLQFLLRVIFDTQPTQDGYGLDDDSMRELKQGESTNNKNGGKSSIKTENGHDSDATDCESEHGFPDDGDHDDPHDGKVNEQNHHTNDHHQQNGHHDDDDDDNEDENGEKYVNMNDRIGSAIRAAREVKKTFSKPLPDIEINAANVTEILRLHLIQSGSFPKGRTIYNGWYSSREDPGLWLCMQEPDLIKKLSDGTVYDLEIEERIKILHTLIYQLLTFIKSRLFMDAASEQLTELRKQYRRDAAEFARWDRENCVKRLQPPKRKNEPTSDGVAVNNNSNSNGVKQSSEQKQELLPHHRLSGDDDADTHSLDDKDNNHDNPPGLKSCLKSNGTSDYHNAEEESDHTNAGTKSKKITFDKSLNEVKVNGHSDCNGNGQSESTADGHQTEEQNYEELERAYQQNTVDYEDYQRERSIRLKQLNETLLDLRTQLRTNQAVYAIHPIGRDRAYRRYWLFQSLPGLFVEQDDEYVGQCLETPTPLESEYKRLFGKDNPLYGVDDATISKDEMNLCTGDETTCCIHGPRRPRERWWFYHQPEAIDTLVEALNKKGSRESGLREVLTSESILIKQRVGECPSYLLNKTILEQSGIRRSRRLRTKTGKRKGRHFSD